MKRTVLEITVALLLSLALTSVLIIALGKSPAQVYRLLLASTWGDGLGVSQTLAQATPLVFSGLAAAIAFRVGLFNIGAEGQMTAALVATAVVGAALPPTVSSWIALPLLASVAMCAGAITAAVPAALKVGRGVHEVVGTILTNLCVAGIALWLGNRWLFVGDSAHSAPIANGAQMPRFGADASSLSASLLLALLALCSYGWFFRKSWRGRAWLSVGLGPQAALSSGIRTSRIWFSAMLASGAVAGLAATHYVLGYKHYYESHVGAGVGYLGLAVAIAGRNRALGVFAAALLFATLAHGAVGVSILLPREAILTWEAITVVALVAFVGRRRDSGID